MNGRIPWENRRFSPTAPRPSGGAVLQITAARWGPNPPLGSATDDNFVTTLMSRFGTTMTLHLRWRRTPMVDRAPLAAQLPGLDGSGDAHPLSGFRGPQVCSLVGITYRQLDYWALTG